MSSKRTVFRSLQEVFPQVDLRILKAVAIEHSTDVDAAVEFVLFEVLPSLNESTESFNTPDYTHGRENLIADGREHESFLGNQGHNEDNTNLLPESSIASDRAPCSELTHAGPLSSPALCNFVNNSNEIFLGNHGPNEDNTNLLPESSIASDSAPCSELTHAGPLSSPAICNFGNNSNAEEDKVHHQAGDGVVSSLPSEPCSIASELNDAYHTTDSFNVKSGVFNDTDVATSSNAYVNNLFISNEEPVSITSRAYVNRKLVSNEELDEQITSILYMSQPSETLEGNSYAGLDANVQEMHGAEAAAHKLPSSPQDMNILIESEELVSKDLPMSDDVHGFSNLEIYNAFPSSFMSNQDMHSSVSEDASNREYKALLDRVYDSLRHDSEEHCSRGISDDSFTSLTDMTHVTAKNTLVGPQSGCGVAMDILEDFVSDVKRNKETLVLSFESIKNMMKDVVLHEERARMAKEEASNAGTDILTNAETMKQMAIHAKETKEMQAAEVYGEKSILATEARELQSRLLDISDQREKSLSIIEEIQQTLEMRIAAAKEELAAAEKEKLEKEAAAHKLLKEQEVIMEEIVQESKRLHQEGEENAKLREFLMDRGHVIDTLQGEMGVICEDIMLLKDRVDGRVPLSRSLQMTSSSLASSSTSSNFGSSTERILLAVDSGDSDGKAAGGNPTQSQPQSDVNGDTAIDPTDVSNKADSDDGWELF